MKVLKNINSATTLLIFALLLVFNNCSPLQLRKHDTYWEWIKGKPGIENTLAIVNRPVEHAIVGERHPYYLWFRTPEIFFNPQGGVYYPDMIMKYRDKYYDTSDLSILKDEDLRYNIMEDRGAAFNAFETGIVDLVLQYRSITDPYSGIKHTLAYCIIAPFLVIFSFPKRIIVYPIHDILKTITLPFATVYYIVEYNKDNEDEE